MKKVTRKQQGAGSGQQESDLPKLAQPAQRALAAAGVQKMAYFADKEDMIANQAALEQAVRDLIKLQKT